VPPELGVGEVASHEGDHLVEVPIQVQLLGLVHRRGLTRQQEVGHGIAEFTTLRHERIFTGSWVQIKGSQPERALIRHDDKGVDVEQWKQRALACPNTIRSEFDPSGVGWRRHL
jgi:hypothetical protein